MVSFDLHVGGAYSNNPSGVIHIAYYYYNNSSGATIKGQISGMAVGVLMNYVKVFYNLSTERGILYVKNERNQYNTIWIDNLTAHDTAPNYDFTQTTIETTSAIDESNYEVIPVSTLYNDGTTNMYYYNGTTSRTLLHSGNYKDYAVARIGDTTTGNFTNTGNITNTGYFTNNGSVLVYPASNAPTGAGGKITAFNTTRGFNIALQASSGGGSLSSTGYWNGSAYVESNLTILERSTDGKAYFHGYAEEEIDDANVTFVSTYIGNSEVYLRKSGRMVTVYGAINVTTQPGGNVTIGTVPAGFKPRGNPIIMAYHMNNAGNPVWLYVFASDGTIRTGNSGSQVNLKTDWYNICGTYAI